MVSPPADQWRTAILKDAWRDVHARKAVVLRLV
jgi:hypothetical protein